MERSDKGLSPTTVRRRFLKRLGAGAGVAVLAGCATNDESTPSPSDDPGGGTTDGGTGTTPAEIPKGGTLDVASAGDPQNLDPHTTTINVAQMVLDNVVEELFTLDENLDITPMLATGYEVSEDETTYTVSLKEGVTFHNGDSLTSADVKYSIERILDPDVGSPRAANFQLVDTIATPDDHTVRFELSRPFAPFIIGLAESASIIPEGSGENRNMKQSPVGTGPFTLENWQTDEIVSLAKFDDYHRSEFPYLDEVAFNVIPEAATRVTQLRSGSAHVMYGVPFQRASDIKEAENTTLQSVSGLWKLALWFNTNEPPFDDARVRRAISHAVNREKIVQGVLFGRGEPAHNPIPPTSTWMESIKAGTPHEFSRQKAKSLFEDAGVDPTSVTTSIKAQRTPGPAYGDTATLIESMLSRIGVTVEVEIMDFSTWLQEVWVDKNYQLAVGSWSGRIDPDGWYYRQFHSEGPWNRWNYSNSEVDQLLVDGRTTTDEAERASIYGRIDQIVSEEAPQVYLFFREELTGLKKGVGGYQLSPAHKAEYAGTYLEQ